jgi:hypothetical protein
LRDVIKVDHSPAHGFGNGSPETESGEEVEYGGPENGDPRRKHARGNHRGDAVGCIVKAIDEIERKRQKDGKQNQD